MITILKVSWNSSTTTFCLKTGPGVKRKARKPSGRPGPPGLHHHGGFRFTEEETFIDVEQQKVLYRWQLEWPSIEKGCEGKPEKRRGVDVMHFKDGKIIRKLTYSKTTLEIDGQRVRLLPERLK